MTTYTTPDGKETWFNVHPKKACEGRPCAIHNPSDHSMFGFRMHLRETGLIERICSHGVGHPDPDSAAYLNEHGPEGARGTWGIHGCDGCCAAITLCRPLDGPTSFVVCSDHETGDSSLHRLASGESQ